MRRVFAAILLICGFLALASTVPHFVGPRYEGRWEVGFERRVGDTYYESRGVDGRLVVAGGLLACTAGLALVFVGKRRRVS
jgi:hypothetical protein